MKELKPQTLRAIAAWEQTVLDASGQYAGPDLHAWSFPYKVGDWVPTDRRYSAMLEWRYAQANKAMYLRQGK